MGFSPEAALATRNETLGAKAASGDQTGLRGAIARRTSCAGSCADTRRPVSTS